MYIEDLITKLASSSIPLSTFDKNVIMSLYNQIYSGMQFTEKQGTLAVNVVKKYKKKLELVLNKNIDNYLSTPQFKHPFRVINTLKTIQIIKNSANEKLIKVQFPYDDAVIARFKQERTKFYYCGWVDEEKAWNFSLDETSIQFLMTLLTEYNFTADEEFMNYAEQIKTIQQNIEKYVPMIVKTEENYNYVNVVEHFPKNTSSNLLEALFEARKLGIFTWDDAIDQEINSTNFDTEIKNFLKSNPSESYPLFLNEKPLATLKNVIKYLLPCLVNISAGAELTKLQNSINFFNDMGIDNSEISVLFRLSSDVGKDFNEFVRNNKLNSPVTENTKVVVISEQVPKTILVHRKTFNSVLNYNFYTAHYKMRDFLRYQPNVINILEKHN